MDYINFLFHIKNFENKYIIILYIHIVITLDICIYMYVYM